MWTVRALFRSKLQHGRPPPSHFGAQRSHFPQERAFLYFDSSLDGKLEREELVAALCSGTKRVGSSKEKSHSRQSSKGPKRYKGAADMLFDVLDLDKSGNITFKGEHMGCKTGKRQRSKRR